MLGWSREELAEASSVHLRTIVDFERNARSPRAATLKSLRVAFESCGVSFLADNGRGLGLRLKVR